MKKQTKSDVFSEGEKQEILKQIISYFRYERDEDLGVIAAEDVLDNFMDILGDKVYNKGIKDSLTYVENHFESLDLDLKALLKLD